MENISNPTVMDLLRPLRVGPKDTYQADQVGLPFGDGLICIRPGRQATGGDGAGGSCVCMREALITHWRRQFIK